MKCPDCKIKMEFVRYEDIDKNGNYVSCYYKCPRCRMEIEEGDEDYEDDTTR